MNTADKIAEIRRQFGNISGYLQPVSDMFLSEYPPACYKRVEWVSGFTGSAGMLVILHEKAALFVDGRYTLQAASEVDSDLFEVHNSANMTPEQWISKYAQNLTIGYDPHLFTPRMLERLARKITLQPVDNLVDRVWKNRPAAPNTPIFMHEELYTGESASSKSKRLAQELKKQKVDAALIADPSSVCWLMNIRAHDVECTPLVLAHALLYSDGKTELIRGTQTFQSLVGKRVLVDEAQTTVAMIEMLKTSGASIIRGEDPCVLPKACKNDVQLAGIRAAHQRDGVAVSKLLRWLETHNDICSVSEMDIADKLLAFRQEQELFVELSFPTIAGSGANGAIVHYRATAKTNRKLQKGELLLLDSGGQYLDGTTDITRTIAIGKPTDEHKDRFTRVLKGHIALATAVFPKDTRGSQLDALARQFLWQVGLDYDHGTGHGVGQFLGVHEGPQRISKRAGDAILQPGMVLSNEPGYYKMGDYGIRIENLVVVIEKEHGFLGFETLTRVPLDQKLIDVSLLDSAEKQWLDWYQQACPQISS